MSFSIILKRLVVQQEKSYPNFVTLICNLIIPKFSGKIYQ